MNTPDELDARLRKADPANNAKLEPLGVEILTAATKSRPSFGLAQRFEMLSAKARSFALGGLVSGAAAIVAVAIVVNPAQTPLIQLAAAPEAGANASAMAPESSDDKMMSMPYLFVTYEYAAGPGLSNETGSGQVYKLARTGSPESVLATVAKIFGVQGSVKKYPDFSDLNPGYFFGESDDPWGMDQKPTVSIWWNGTGSWNYYNPGDITMSSSPCVAEDTEGNCQEWAEVLPTPELLPSRAEAIAKALEVFNATGLAVTGSDLKVDYSEWGVYITAALSVDGQPTSTEWYIGWSSTGELSYAGGHSVVAQAAGVFNTISAVQAVDRLADWRWYGSPASSYYEKYQGIAASSGVRTDEAIDPGFPTDSTGEGQLEPEIVTLTIVSADRVLVSIWDAAGDVWLVPGLLMVNDLGWFDSVIALVEGVIQLPEPSPVDIMPMPEPAPDSSVSN
jgi:hypothetical protein